MATNEELMQTLRQIQQSQLTTEDVKKVVHEAIANDVQVAVCKAIDDKLVEVIHEKIEKDVKKVVENTVEKKM